MAMVGNSGGGAAWEQAEAVQRQRTKREREREREREKQRRRHGKQASNATRQKKGEGDTICHR